MRRKTRVDIKCNVWYISLRCRICVYIIYSHRVLVLASLITVAYNQIGSVIMLIPQRSSRKMRMRPRNIKHSPCNTRIGCNAKSLAEDYYSNCVFPTVTPRLKGRVTEQLESLICRRYPRL